MVVEGGCDGAILMDGLRMRSIGVERAGRERTADVKPSEKSGDFEGM